MSETTTIEIRVNGALRPVPAGCTVSQLLDLLGVKPAQAAVERNQQIVRRADHATTQLSAGDELEVVTLFGGG